MEKILLAFASAALLAGCQVASRVVSFDGTCSGSRQYERIAEQNAASLTSARMAPFGRPERGWQVYALHVAHIIGTTCTPDTRRFAERLAAWQSDNSLPATGAMDEATLGEMKRRWQDARPF